jgi:hypothetical protein
MPLRWITGCQFRTEKPSYEGGRADWQELLNDGKAHPNAQSHIYAAGFVAALCEDMGPGDAVALELRKHRSALLYLVHHLHAAGALQLTNAITDRQSR